MNEPVDKKNLLTWIILVTLSLVWGASFFLMKKGLVAFSPPQVASLRISFSFLALLPVLIFKFRKVKREKLKWIFLSAVLGSGIPPFLFTFGLVKLDSGFEEILNSLTPLFTLLVGIIFFQFKTRWIQIVGVLIGLTGAIMLVIANTDFENPGELKYAFGVVMATICYGFAANILKSKLQQEDPLAVSSMVFFLIVPFALGILFSTDFIHVVKTNEHAASSIAHIIILSVFGTAYSLVAYNYLIQKTNVLWASTVTYVIPVVALMLGVSDGEPFHLIYIAGMIFILSGVYLTR